MRLRVVCILLTALVLTPVGHVLAGVFSYTDAAGNVHFVDSEEKIPPEYRARKKNVKLPARPAPAAADPLDVEPESAPDAEEPAQTKVERDRDGHDEQWWRRRKEKLESRKRRIEAELAKLEDAAPINVRGFYTRKALYERGQKKERLKKELAEVEAQVAALREEARRAGAPPGWLR